MTLEVAQMPDIALRSDPNWIRQVIVSLIRNAIRYARDGGTVRLAPEIDVALAGLSVTDNGPGIDPQDQSRVFDRFVQGPTKAAKQGFGVGLALAHWVITEQGGDITLTSPLPRSDALGPAAGTKISVRLPIAKD